VVINLSSRFVLPIAFLAIQATTIKCRGRYG